jgi:hypothetical protein
MITQAVENMSYALADSGAYASSIVGKPLALVNVGFSLELATPLLQLQTTLLPLPYKLAHKIVSTNPVPRFGLG